VRFNTQELWSWLPVILRRRDAEAALVSPGWLELSDRERLAQLDARASTGTATTDELQERERLREQALAGPLASLLAVIGEQFAVLEEDIEQLYDDQFIETCADWVVPYIGDLIGYRGLHGAAPAVSSPRAEVAHTIAYRRRKGTVAVLEQLARDVSGWSASAAEFFQRLVVTQYTNHIRPQCLASPDMRDWRRLQRVGSAFDTVMRSVDVRRIVNGRGRHNIPNVGVFLWRIGACPLRGSFATRVDDLRWRFHPLGLDQPIWLRPRTAAAIENLATFLDVPGPIGRRDLDAELTARRQALADGVEPADPTLADPVHAFRVVIDGHVVPPEHVLVCNLLPESPADPADAWRLPPAALQVASTVPNRPALVLPSDPAGILISIDPERGRLALPAGTPAPASVRVDFHYGFGADLGGGEYERADSYESVDTPPALIRVPDDAPTIQGALGLLGVNGGVVLITDDGRYVETPNVAVPEGRRIEIRADDEHRPTLVLAGDLELTGGKDSEIRLNGLLITGAALHVPAVAGNELARLDLRHCTLVPGLALAPDATPTVPGAVTLSVDLPDADVALDRCIVGALRVEAHSRTRIKDSIVDATGSTRVAFAAPGAAAADGLVDQDAAANDSEAGGSLTLEECTVVGKLRTVTVPLVSNSILFARLADADTWAAPVLVERRQEGCVRFSWLPDGALVPRRYHCWPESAEPPERANLRFSTLRYGFPEYAQLSSGSGSLLLTGASDEGQPGAYHYLQQPQRETNLRVRLDEYLRVGLQGGVLYAS
jgi:hypothetical protein